MRKGEVVTSYCGKIHKLSDGKPVRHRCHVMPTEALHAEKNGDRDRYNVLLCGWKKKREYNGAGS